MFDSHLPISMPTMLTIVPNARPIRDAPMKYGALAEYPVQRLPPGVESVSGGEVEDRRKVGQVRHPVAPARDEAGEVPEGDLRPDVEAALFGVARGQRDDADAEGQRHREETDAPDGDRRRAAGRGRRDPLQVRPRGDDEEEDVAEPHPLVEPRRMRARRAAFVGKRRRDAGEPTAGPGTTARGSGGARSRAGPSTARGRRCASAGPSGRPRRSRCPPAGPGR